MPNGDRVSKFPDQVFKNEGPLTPLQEVAVRLIVGWDTDEPEVVGTGTVLSGHLIITARHVIADLVSAAVDGVMPKTLVAVQLVPLSGSFEYLIWDIHQATLDPVADLALLHVAVNPARSSPNRTHVWKQPVIEPFPPSVGAAVAAFGFCKGRVAVSQNEAGGKHYDLNDEPMSSTGIVEEIHALRLDSVLRPFPCYRVSARFDPGMSGGPVFNESGALCGIVCTGMWGAHEDGNPISYASTLWPMFRLRVSQDRGPAHPRGIQYVAMELARGGQVRVKDLARLEAWFAERVR